MASRHEKIAAAAQSSSTLARTNPCMIELPVMIRPFIRAISSRVISSGDGEIAVKQKTAAVDLIPSVHKQNGASGGVAGITRNSYRTMGCQPIVVVQSENHSHHARAQQL